MSKTWKPPVLGGVLLMVVVGIVIALVLVLGGSDEEESDAGVLVAARDGATSFFSLDYRHAEDDVDRVLALSTGSFKREYGSRRAEIVKGVQDKKLVVTATIPDDGVGLEYLTAKKAQVLVSVDISTTASTGGATTDRYRTRVLLTRVGDRWLVSGLNQVG